MFAALASVTPQSFATSTLVNFARGSLYSAFTPVWRLLVAVFFFFTCDCSYAIRSAGSIPYHIGVGDSE